jgi:AraC-like DNA-binding protein
MSLQRIGPLASVPEVLEDHGVALEPILARFDLAPDALSRPDNVISFAVAGRVLEACARACRCPHFGLLVGERNDHRALGLVGSLMANAPTLGEALFDYVSHQHRYSRAAVVYLMRGFDSYFFGYAIYNRHIEGNRHIYDLCAALGANLLRSLCGPDFAPQEFLICHQPPKDRRPYYAALGPNVEFNQSQLAFVLSPKQLSAPIANADAAERKRVAQKVMELHSIGSLDVASHVRHLLKPNILLGRASREVIAKQVGTQVRTLHRRLREQETSYRELEQEVRFGVACELLQITDLEIADIAVALDYSSPSAFDRAFSRWADTTPSDWRRLNGDRPDAGHA